MASQYLELIDPSPSITIAELSDDTEDDKAAYEVSSPFVFGGAALSAFYNTDSTLTSTLPLRVVRLALRYGCKAFDTSPYYGPSEVILGQILKALDSEFPRSSYKLMTKCGRYKSKHDYSPSTIRASVMRSLKRLNTNFLDVVYLHDVEFVAERFTPTPEGDHSNFLEQPEQYGLDDIKARGPGDESILAAVMELRDLQSQGIIGKVGITGYPLPCLLRIALLVKTVTGKPLDVIMSYSHLNLQNDSLAKNADAFAKIAGIETIITASPLNMGLLTLNPPSWHPAPPELRRAVAQAVGACQDWEGGLPNIALGYALQSAASRSMPCVVGLSTHKEVHEIMKIIKSGSDAEREAKEIEVQNIFGSAGYLNWSWDPLD